eukprot:6764901-Pyramimonas_sp.AAC.2
MPLKSTSRCLLRTHYDANNDPYMSHLIILRGLALFVFRGPPVPVTVRVCDMQHPREQRPVPFSHPVLSSPRSCPTALPLGRANITRRSRGGPEGVKRGSRGDQEGVQRGSICFARLAYPAYTLLVQPPWFSSTLLLSRPPQPLCLSLPFSHSRPCLPGSLGLVPFFRTRAFRPPRLPPPRPARPLGGFGAPCL